MQLNMFEHVPTIILGDRDGQTFDRQRDGIRLNDQAQDVYNFMADYCWHSLREIAAKTGHPEASISARIRDLKKPKFGSFKIEKRYIQNGLWQYRMGHGDRPDGHHIYTPVTDNCGPTGQFFSEKRRSAVA